VESLLHDSWWRPCVTFKQCTWRMS